MRVLVTGGAGFIGSHLVDRFLLEGFQVRALDSLEPRVHPRGRPSYLPRQVEFVHGTVNDRSLLLEALRDVDIISHQAAYQDYMPDFSRFLEVNAVGTARNRPGLVGGRIGGLNCDIGHDRAGRIGHNTRECRCAGGLPE